jgi:REP element-mobilizing transposase RayT
LDEFIVMPNHIHGIIWIGDREPSVGAPLAGARHMVESVQRTGTRPAPTLSDIVRVFKSITTLEYIHGVRENGWISFQGKLWQRNYYERVIRDEEELFEIRKYIQENPLKWDSDPENLNRIATASSVDDRRGVPCGRPSNGRIGAAGGYEARPYVAL